jgi:beta-lactamase regulating signal transducer with metallopeptidase domain
VAVLRRLTFYNWNRWFLLIYSVLSFFIHFINISPVLERNETIQTNVIEYIPAVETFTVNDSKPFQNNATAVLAAPDWILIIFLLGVFIALFRVSIQYVSFLRLRQKAQLIADDRIKIYRVNQKIIPFSFGNAVFINPGLHGEEELKEIIRHEFVHIRQKHTADVIWSEILCIVNWYNPFVWRLRHSMRQNLEFIADNKVLQNGIDKKQYQYLLLKVMGVPQFKIANGFNFSSLKKRIVMMNKLKSAKVHLLKFLFVLPVIIVVLVAFRNNNKTTSPQNYFAGLVIDIGTHKPISGVRVVEQITGKKTLTDDNGYYSFSLPQNDKLKLHFSFDKNRYAAMFSNVMIEKRDTSLSNNNYVELIGMKASTVKEDSYGCFSKLSLKYQQEAEPVNYTHALELYQDFLANPYTGIRDDFFKRNAQVKNLVWQTDPERIAVIYLKNGSLETYKIDDTAQYENLVNKYGKLPYMPQSTLENKIKAIEKVLVDTTAISGFPLADTVKLPDNYTSFLKRNSIVKRLNWKENEVIIELKSGKKESYSLNNEQSIAAAEKKYGKLPVTPPPPPPPKVDLKNFKPPVKIDSTAADQSMQELINISLFLKEKSAAYKDSLQKKPGNKDLKIIYGFLQQRNDLIETQIKSLPPPPPPQKQKQMPSIPISFTTDKITWDAKKKVLILEGNATINNGDHSLASNEVNVFSKEAVLVYINDKQLQRVETYKGKEGERYRLKKLEAEEAIKKYGEKGKKAVIEINSF